MEATKNLTDITDLSDAALDVFLSVRAGDDCVTVDHLSPGERYAVCEALGVKPPVGWLHDRPSKDSTAGHPRLHCVDYEGLILDEQDERFNG